MNNKKQIIAKTAPEAIGPYSQAIQSGNMVYISGQIPLDPSSMELVDATIDAATHQVLQNLREITVQAGGGLDSIVKLTILLVNIDDFPIVNSIMADYFTPPYPARATYAVAALPKGARMEIEAVMEISNLS